MLQGRTALVTGSTSGIGLGIARALAAEGCSVLLNGIADTDAMNLLCAELAETYAVKVLFNGADLTQTEACEALVEDAVTRLGRIDILVNNAGIQHLAPIESFPVERWDTILALNLTAAFHTMRKTVPLMRREGWGRIINIASVHGLVASPEKAAYVAAKHGLVGLTKVVALETANAGITCNAICPGWVLTPLVESQIERKARAEAISPAKATYKLLKEKQPSNAYTKVEELGALTVFLCSEAAKNMTGGCIPIDGGWTAQ